MLVQSSTNVQRKFKTFRKRSTHTNLKENVNKVLKWTTLNESCWFVMTVARSVDVSEVTLRVVSMTESALQCRDEL